MISKLINRLVKKLPKGKEVLYAQKTSTYLLIGARSQYFRVFIFSLVKTLFIQLFVWNNLYRFFYQNFPQQQ